MSKKIYRVIDANFNRALEGIRVCEDFCRFIINNEEISKLLKGARHQVKEAVKSMLTDKTIGARDVSNDKTKFFDEKQELKRESLSQIIQSNIHRATEAIRSIEEYSKYLKSSSEQNTFQKVRFLLYEIEQQIIEIILRKNKLSYFENSIYVEINIDKYFPEEITAKISKMIDDGVTILQVASCLSNKKKLLAISKKLSVICSEKKVLFIIKEHIDVAILAQADGVVLTENSLSVLDYREILPVDMITGVIVDPINQTQPEELEDVADFFLVRQNVEINEKIKEKLNTIINNIKQKFNSPIIALESKDNNVNKITTGKNDKYDAIMCSFEEYYLKN